MQDWITVKPRHASNPLTQHLRGVDVTVYVSPHSIPKAVRALPIPEPKLLRIEFEYLDGRDQALEDPRVSRDGLISVFFGRRSGRIERIDVADAHLTGGQIKFTLKVATPTMVHEIERELLELEEHEPNLARKMNFDAARYALGTLLHS